MASRRFRSATRVALFLAARGRCAQCGARLEAGWHGDHLRPLRAGGETTPGIVAYSAAVLGLRVPEARQIRGLVLARLGRTG